YWSEAAKLSANEAAPADAVALADAAAAAWKETGREPVAKGERARWIDGKAFLVFWRNDAQQRVLFLTSAETWMQPVAAEDEAASSWAIVDSDGQVMAGRKQGPGRAAIRTAAEMQLPWTLYLTRPPSTAGQGILTRGRFVWLSGTVMILFLVACTYFIA